MPTRAEEVRKHVMEVGSTLLKPLIKSNVITRDQFKEICPLVVHDMRDHNPWEGDFGEAFQQTAISKFEAAKLRVLGSPSGNGHANGNGSANGNGHANGNGSANGNGHHANGSAAQPPPAHLQAAAPPPAMPPPAAAPAPPAASPMEVEQAAQQQDGATRGVVRPRENAENSSPEEPPPTAQQSRYEEPLPQQNQLQPLEHGGGNVVNLADMVAPPPQLRPFAMPRRNGTRGKPIRVMVNACKLEHPNWLALNIQQYDVSFTWIEAAGGVAPIPKGVSDGLLKPLCKLFPNGACAYDGKKNVYAPCLLDHLQPGAAEAGWSVAKDGEAAACVFTLLFDGPDKPDNKVVVRPVGDPLEMSKLIECNQGGTELGLEFRKYMAALDVILQPVRMYKQIKNAFYNDNQQANWGQIRNLGRDGNAKLWLGYRQTIVDTTNGPMVFIDSAAAAIHAPCELLAFLASKLNIRDKSQIQAKHVMDARRELTTMIGGRKPKILSRHSTREYRLADIDDVPADKATFYDEDAKRERTVVDYFKEKYPQHRINYPHLPCVCVGKQNDPKRIRIPIEFIKLAGGEPVQITPSIQAEMIKETAMAPAQRFQEIRKIFEDRARGPGSTDDASAAPAFGLRVGQEAHVSMEPLGRVLPSPDLGYYDHQNRRNVTVKVNASQGGWKVMANGQDVGFMEPGAPPRSWAVVNFAPREVPTRDLEDFVRQFVDLARKRGLNLNGDGRRPPLIEMEAPRQPREVGAALQERLAREGLSPDTLDFVLCVLPETKNLYEAVKRWSEATTGVPVQCCKAKKMMGDGGGKGGKGKGGGKAMLLDPQYHAGILLKTNLKLGGGNVHLVDDERTGRQGLGLMRDRPTMVCGVDVHHPPPGSSRPSWAALVASMDEHCAHWHTIVDEQKGRQEQIGAPTGGGPGESGGFSLLVHMRTCLQQFLKANKVPPARIIFYRDGVAHNQFDVIMAQEIGAICKALDEQGLSGSCELIFVVAQKKTNARFAVTVGEGGTKPSGAGGKGGGKGFGKGGGKGGDGGDGSELGNAPCGTVIDHGITDRKSFDFYLVSQHGLKGTCRPTHFHVLTCPDTLTADEIQQFTFDLCHCYARCTKIASRPAPIYYAHLAAAHAPWYEKDGYKDVADSWEVGSTSSGGSRGSAKSKSNYEPLNTKQANRLYYC